MPASESARSVAMSATSNASVTPILTSCSLRFSFSVYAVRVGWFDRRTATPPPPRPEDQRSLLSISDPAFASYFGLGTPNYSGITIGEGSALSISAVWRAVSLISGTIASLPARSVQANDDGTRDRIPSWVDQPAGPDGATAFEFWETVLVHLLLHGNAYCVHIRNGAGAMVGLYPVHPMAVSIEVDTRTGLKTYTVTLDDGEARVYDSTSLLHIPALSTDGIRGLSPISVARNSLGTAIAGDRAAAKMFSDGALMAGMITPEDDITGDEAKEIKASLDAKVAGWENASSIAVINRKLKFTPWTMSHEDAQFLQSRQFQIEEIARWYGVPPHQLMQTEKQTSWGTGVAEQNRGLARTTLGPWAARIEQRVSRLMAGNRRLEFDFAGLERPTPEQEIDLLIKQVQGGLMTVNEARAVRNMAPLDGGDALQPTAPGAGPGEDTDGV